MRSVQIFILVLAVSSIACTKSQEPSNGRQSTSSIAIQKSIDSLKHIADSFSNVLRLDSLERIRIGNREATQDLDRKVISTVVQDVTQSKDVIQQWKKVRNGSALYVKWVMKVFVGSQCYLIINGNESSYGVALYGKNTGLHSKDVLIVTGEASGADEMGDVKINAIDVVNRGVE